MDHKNENEKIKTLLKDFIDEIFDFRRNVKEEKVFNDISQETLSRIEEMEIPETGRPVCDVYKEMTEDVFSNVVRVQHPRSFACVPGPASVFSWMGEVMNSAYNPHASCSSNAPAADLIEKKLIRWMCGLAGYPKNSGGLFVSGGSMANLTALTAARDAKLRPQERRDAVAYISGQTHSSLAKALHIIGFDRSQIRKVCVDGQYRMDTDDLIRQIERDIAQGRKPFLVIATAGTTNTGSIDPLRDIASICGRYDMWMHVDGAFGASVLISDRYRKLLRGIELSDSLSWDAHKWMMQTYGCSVALVRDISSLTNSFSAHPEYLKDAAGGEDSVEFWDLGPELTRPARSLKLWTSLQAMGTEAFQNAIDHGCAMAELAQRTAACLSGFQIVSSASLGIVNFRYCPEGMEDWQADEINRQIARSVTAGGYAQVFTTELDGKKVLRMCTINPETTEEDIVSTIKLIGFTADKLTERTA